MTSILIIDADPARRQSLENQLAATEQFSKVHSCAGFAQAHDLLKVQAISVVLVDRGTAVSDSSLLEIEHAHPNLGVVILQDHLGVLTPENLADLGAHAQASPAASPMELIASVAKALVNRFKPSAKILRKFIKS